MIVNNILHAISRVENRLLSSQDLSEYRAQCAQEVQSEYDGTYEDGPDKENVDYWHSEMSLADKELARRNRR